jgi:4-aminobutyrate aminotransferase/(S)-3-amino-2-methylpropionate transaminase
MTDFGMELPTLRGPVPGPASKSLADRLRAVESRNVTFLGDAFPVFWEEARGANVRDADENVFLDFTGAFGVALAGHRNPLVTARVAAQTEQLVHGMGDVHPPAVKVELLERLDILSPWEGGRTLLCGSGSEAVEAALKTGTLASGRPGVLSFRGGYHGLTAGALAVTHRAHFRAPFRESLFSGVAFAPFPTDAASAAQALDDVTRLLDTGTPDGHAIGTVIVEPIQGRAGVVMPPSGFLAELVRLSRAAGCVTVMDEVFTGFGRTGQLFAGPADEAIPDVLCVGKALGGGLPIGACMGTREVMDAWPEASGEALHTSTFLGHPLCAAAALGFLDELEEGQLIRRIRERGESLMRGLVDALAGADGVGEVRGRGLLLAVELAAPDGLPLAGGGAAVAERALAKGLLVLPAGDVGHVVELTPPAVLTDEQAEWGVATLSTCVLEELESA